eukprot:g1497.t1
MSEKKLGITLITGFLGSGKTTLLNRILSEKHGRKIAVIENEFGEIGIDDELVKQQIRLAGKDERDFCLEMNNGCICCSVRADMAKAVAQMIELHRSGKELDGIIIETTGMADPAPVIQTFYVDKNLASGVFLDGVLTVVDAKHIHKHLNEKDGKEAHNQIAYADRVLVNKVDLVSKEELKKVSDAIFKINSAVDIVETKHCKVDIKYLLDIRAFEIDRILKNVDPEFLETGEHKHSHGHHDHDHDHHHHGDGCNDKSCDHPDHDHGHHHHAEAKKKKYDLVKAYDEHHDDKAKKEEGDHHHHHRTHRHKHRHSSKVTSVGLSHKGVLDYDVLVDWLTNLLLRKGENIYRMKGVLSVDDDDEMFVVQGTHQTWDMNPVGPWKSSKDERVSKMIFIGKDLNREALTKGFKTCQMGTPEHKEAREDLMKVWEAKEFWNKQLMEREAQSIKANQTEYGVVVHNGTHGLGMLLSERVRKEDGLREIYVPGFAKLPEGVPNNALDTGLILPGDALIGINGQSLNGVGLKEVVKMIRRLPRGAGSAGALVSLQFRLGPDEDEEDAPDASSKMQPENASVSEKRKKSIESSSSSSDEGATKRLKVWKG